MATETIQLEVDAETAETFRKLSDQERRKAALLWKLDLQAVAHPEPRSLADLMKEIGEEAQARGMTPEILKDILGEDNLEGCF